MQPFTVRADSLEKLQRRLQYCHLTDEENIRVRLALMTQIKDASQSAQLIFEHIRLILESHGCSLLTATSNHHQPCTPYIEHKTGKQEELKLPRLAAQLIEELVTYFLGKRLRELKSLDPNECTACIKILALYLQHGRHEEPRRPRPMERALTLTAMQSLWHLLLKAIPTQFREDTKDFSKLYGEAAFQTVMHRIGLEGPVVEVKVQATAGSDRRHSYQGVANVSHGARKHIVVPGEIPPASDSDSRDIIKRLSNLKDPLPIAEMPAVDTLLAIQSKLLKEFPWANEAIDAIFGDMVAQRRYGAIELKFTPVLLLGPPGVGKTRLVRRFAEEVALPFMAIGLAGMDDSRSLLGTSRGWNSAQPAPLIEFLSARKSASALMLLDEMDKVTHRSTVSPSPSVALLAFLEQENARNFFDSFLQTPVDLSKVNFMATANTVDGIPGPLLSRMRKCFIRRPSPRQMSLAVSSAAADIANEWGLNPEVFPPVTMFDLAAVPLNMRDLKVLVKAHLAEWASEHLQRSKFH